MLDASFPFWPPFIFFQPPRFFFLFRFPRCSRCFTGGASDIGITTL